MEIDTSMRKVAHLRHEMQNIFDLRREILQKRLIQDYRNNSLEHDKMVGFIAELSAMDEIIDRVTRQITPE